jgi:hypothetical protein
MDITMKQVDGSANAASQNLEEISNGNDNWRDIET